MINVLSQEEYFHFTRDKYFFQNYLKLFDQSNKNSLAKLCFKSVHAKNLGDSVFNFYKEFREMKQKNKEKTINITKLKKEKNIWFAIGIGILFMLSKNVRNKEEMDRIGKKYFGFGEESHGLYMSLRRYMKEIDKNINFKIIDWKKLLKEKQGK